MTDSPEMGHYVLRAEEVFDRARRREILDSIMSYAFGTRNDMISLEEAKRIIQPTGESYQGTKTIEVSKIIGSEERYSDFSRNFLPRRSVARRRWGNIHVAQQREIELPAIMVYELGGYYFVRDGNHRVSVAKQTGKVYIEAHVTSLTTKIALEGIKGAEDRTRAVIGYEQERFLQSFHRFALPQGEEIQFTAVGRYDDVALHIACHRRERQVAGEPALEYDDAVESWYKTIYRPITQLIRDSRVLKYAPGRTEADLYVWMVRHWDEISVSRGYARIPNRRLKRRFSNKDM